jgi:hypothetical protein
MCGYVLVLVGLPSLQFIQGTVNKNCDVYLDELKESMHSTCGVDASLSTIWRALKRSGYTMKKVRRICTTDEYLLIQEPQLTKTAIERSAAKRAAYMTKIGWNYTPEQLVMVDESACNCKVPYRGRAWALQGRRAMCQAFFVRGRR